MKIPASFHELGFVFVDIGASGSLPPRFEFLSSVADLLRFDPDAREIETVGGENGRSVITINKAVVEDDRTEIEFYLTKSPFCSSSLEPDFAKLKAFEYVKLFEFEKTVSVPAITLELAAQEAGLESLNWINLDTQGTELRIMKSLPPPTIRSVVAVDIESSLYAHYHGADTLPEIHKFMVDSGFWIAETRSQSRTRITSEAAQILKQKYAASLLNRHFPSTFHKSPTTIECLYLRTIDSAIALGYQEEDYCRLAIACLAAGVPEYAFQAHAQCTATFGPSDLTSSLESLIDASFKDRSKATRIQGLCVYLKKKLRGMVGK